MIEHMESIDELPPDLADMPPGLELAIALSRFDPALVSNHDCPTVALAQRRQLTHHQALMLAATVELGRCAPRTAGDTRRLSQPSQWADGEIAALFTCSERAARQELDFAEQVVTHMPLVYEAMLAGRLDRAKAWVFADHLHDMLPEHQAAICAALVEPAVGWTPGKLANQLRRTILEHDPDWAARRYRAAVRERGVTAYLDQNGTMTITGQGLAPEEAAAAMARIDELAAAIRRAGHPNLLRQIRADVYVALLDGTLNQLTRAQIITEILRRVRPEDTETTPPSTPEGRSHDDQGGDNQGGGDAAGGEPVTGIEIRAGLATLLGLDERCGQLTGFDHVLPETARRTVARQHRGAEWRFAVTDTEGRVVFGGLTRKRPSLPPGQPPGRCRGGIVELHITADLLAALTSGGPGAPPAGLSRWAPVLADITAQYADRARILAQLDARPGDRFPHTALNRYLCIRDRTCVWPGCRRSATNSQIDHTRDYADGGPTIQVNTAPLCARHHLYKTAGVWKMRQTRPGVFEWISPLGRTYRTQAEPLNPPPTPPAASPPAPRTPPANDPDPPPF
jgi:hypothetical protein